MIKKRRPLSLDKISLSNPQRLAVAQLLAGQKNKYKKLLHEAHERLHIIGDHVGSVEIWINANGAVEYVSPSFEKVFGHPAQDFLEKNISFVHLCLPEDLHRVRKDLSAVLEGTTFESVSYRFVHSGGHIVWTLCSWHPVLTRKDRIVGARASFEDVTAVTLLKEFHALWTPGAFDGSIAASTIPVCRLSEDGVVRDWSAGAEAEFGWSGSERIGVPFPAILSATGTERFSANFPPPSDGPLSLLVEVRCRDGSERGARLAVHPSAGLKSAGPESAGREILCLFLAT
jgi:PAS domain S-box-containing protein